MKQITLRDMESGKVNAIFISRPRWSWLPVWWMRFHWLRKTERYTNMDVDTANNVVVLPPNKKGDRITVLYETDFRGYENPENQGEIRECQDKLYSISQTKPAL